MVMRDYGVFCSQRSGTDYLLFVTLGSLFFRLSADTGIAGEWERGFYYYGHVMFLVHRMNTFGKRQ